jgi:hypothetical protein
MNQLKLKTLCNFWILFGAMFVLFLQGCAMTKTPPVEPLTYKSRTKSITNEDVTVTVAVPTIVVLTFYLDSGISAEYHIWVETPTS